MLKIVGNFNERLSRLFLGEHVRGRRDRFLVTKTAVGSTEYTVTKTDSGANVSHNVTEGGAESSRDYVIGVGDNAYNINITFDTDGNISALSTNDQTVTVDNTNKTLTIGDYTVHSTARRTL